MPKQDNHPGQVGHEGAEDLARRAQRVMAEHIASKRLQRQPGQLGSAANVAAPAAPKQTAEPARADATSSFDAKLKRLTGKIRKASRTLEKLSRLADELKGERRK